MLPQLRVYQIVSFLNMTILRLTHISDERLEVYASLTNHQLRNSLDPRRGVLIAESEIVVRVAIGHGIEPISMLLDERKVPSMSDVLDGLPSHVPVFVLPEEEMRKLTGYKVTRGVLCAMRRPARPSLAELLEDARNVVVLEGMTDTSNVGAIFRNAAALGADAVVVAPNCADPLSRRAVRVSMGNVFLVPWARAERPWPETCLEQLAAREVTCVALALQPGALELDDPMLKRGDRRALFFGAEGTGLDRKTIEACDMTAIIPMSHGVDSLNVAASSAVAMWELFAKTGR